MRLLCVDAKVNMQKYLLQPKRAVMCVLLWIGHIYDLSEEIKLEKNKKHNIEILVDRLVVRRGD